MAQHSYPSEPPAGVSVELLWRLAHRMYHDHQAAGHQAAGHRAADYQAAAWAAAAGPGAPDEGRTCHACAQPWPCSGRRLAELGLSAAGA